VSIHPVAALLLLPLVSTVAGAANAPAAVSPQITFQIVNMDPATPLSLQPGNTVYLDIQYESNVPVRITALPYDQGKKVSARISDDQLQQPGKGDVFAWFTLTREGAVDEIRLSASLEDGGTVVSEAQPVTFNWDDKAADHAPAAWVEPMRQKELHRQYGETEHKESISSAKNIGGLLVTLLVLLSLVGGGGWLFLRVVRSRGK
jgi:hypothetical protein